MELRLIFQLTPCFNVLYYRENFTKQVEETIEKLKNNIVNRWDRFSFEQRFALQWVEDEDNAWLRSSKEVIASESGVVEEYRSN